jgi:hypothetical protein
MFRHLLYLGGIIEQPVRLINRLDDMSRLSDVAQIRNEFPWTKDLSFEFLCLDLPIQYIVIIHNWKKLMKQNELISVLPPPQNDGSKEEEQYGETYLGSKENPFLHELIQFLNSNGASYYFKKDNKNKEPLLTRKQLFSIISKLFSKKLNLSFIQHSNNKRILKRDQIPGHNDHQVDYVIFKIENIDLLQSYLEILANIIGNTSISNHQTSSSSSSSSSSSFSAIKNEFKKLASSSTIITDNNNKWTPLFRELDSSSSNINDHDFSKLQDSRRNKLSKQIHHQRI